MRYASLPATGPRSNAAGHGVFRHNRDEFREPVLEFCREHGVL